MVFVFSTLDTWHDANIYGIFYIIQYLYGYRILKTMFWGNGSSDGGVRSSLPTVRPQSCFWSNTWLKLYPTTYENAETDLLQVLVTNLLLHLIQKKLKEVEDTCNRDPEAKDETMEAFDKIEAIAEQLKSILARLSTLDTIECSVKNIETNLANLKVRTAKLEDFQATAKKDIAELQKSCSFNGDKCKEYKEDLSKKLDEQNKRITSMLERERLLRDQINDLISKNLYLEFYSRRENIKFFNIREEREEDTEEILRKFMEKELGFRNAHTVEIQRVHRLSRRNNDTDARPIIARFLRLKYVEEIFALGRRLEGSNFQMFRDLPREIIKLRKDQMAVFKEARRNGMRASFNRSQPDKLYMNGDFWPCGKPLDATEWWVTVLFFSYL